MGPRGFIGDRDRVAKRGSTRRAIVPFSKGVYAHHYEAPSSVSVQKEDIYLHTDLDFGGSPLVKAVTQKL